MVGERPPAVLPGPHPDRHQPRPGGADQQDPDPGPRGAGGGVCQLWPMVPDQVPTQDEAGDNCKSVHQRPHAGGGSCHSDAQVLLLR